MKSFGTIGYLAALVLLPASCGFIIGWLCAKSHTSRPSIKFTLGPYDVETTVPLSEVGGPLSGFKGDCQKHIDSHGIHHENFIYVDSFDLKHLPESMMGLPDEVQHYFVNSVKSRARLVVRISGGKISHSRPDTWADGTAYIFNEIKGQSTYKVGSGWVWRIKETVCSSDRGCGRTKWGQHRTRKCWVLLINTSRHVVFDTSEAQSCRFDLFNDKPNSDDNYVQLPGDGGEEGAGARVWVEDTERDCCIVKCFTHDPELGQKLVKLDKEFWESRSRLDHAIVTYNVDPWRLPVVLISHPHGKVKYISLGCHKGQDGFIKMYDTPSCPGSSGGLVVHFPSLGNRLRFYEKDETGRFKNGSKLMVWDVDEKKWREKGDSDSIYLYVSQPHSGIKPDVNTGDLVGYSSDISWYYT